MVGNKFGTIIGNNGRPNTAPDVLLYGPNLVMSRVGFPLYLPALFKQAQLGEIVLAGKKFQESNTEEKAARIARVKGVITIADRSTTPDTYNQLFKLAHQEGVQSYYGGRSTDNNGIELGGVVQFDPYSLSGIHALARHVIETGQYRLQEPESRATLLPQAQGEQL